MPSIINGLFAGRSGISSHGAAIAVIGDNISNSSTPGYKTSRAEFEDLMAGGQTAGKVIGSGSQTSAVSTIFEQGTLEFTGRPLDLAIDGNGYFVVAQGTQRFYSRAGNFKIDSSGYIVNQNGLFVQGFQANGSGALSALNVNNVSQASVATNALTVSGNVDASATILTNGVADIPAVSVAGSAGAQSATTYANLNAVAEFSTTVDVFDSLGAGHTVTFFYFHTASNTYTVRGYVNSEDVDSAASPPSGLPRLVAVSNAVGANGSITMNFNGSGGRTNAPTAAVPDLAASIAWNNGSTASAITMNMDPFTQFASASNVRSISQDGQGVGAVSKLSIEKNGDVFAILTNGQTAIIGTVAMANFANPEGLTRVGQQLLQQSPQSGEPVIGRPQSGTLGRVQSGSTELSTVDIANEFVKLITVQRGFQANSRIITTINQLLNEIIQLA